MAATILVSDLIREREKELELTLLVGAKGLHREITVSEINRPGLALSGYLDYFPSERVQISGLGEHSYLLTLSPSARLEALRKIFAYKNLPCLVITRGIKPHKELLKIAEHANVP